MTGRSDVSPLGCRSPRLAAARRLGRRAHRYRGRTFLVEGPQALGAAQASGAALAELFVTVSACARYEALVAAAADGGVPVRTVTDAAMRELAQTTTPQGLLAVCGFVDVPLDRVLDDLTGTAADDGRRPPLVAVLANARDPGNAGTVLRTADAAGADAVIVTDDSVDVYNGKCVRASAGSVFHLPVVVDVAAAEAVAALRTAGLRILAADARAPRSLDQLGARELAAPVAWLFGNEAWGLPPRLVAAADESVAVPVYGTADSLNLATAAAVCLYASAWARRRPGCR